MIPRGTSSPKGIASRRSFCFSCEMAGNGGRAVEVLFPEGVDRIEAGLVNERVSYQNWRYEVDGGVYRGVREKGGE